MTMFNETNQISILAHASENRFFVIKDAEKMVQAIAAIADELHMDPADVGAILEKEKDARSAAHAAKVKHTLEKRAALEALPATGGVDEIRHEIREGNKFVVTVAQNNTDVDSNMLAALETFCSEAGAELIVCPTLYNQHGFNQPDGRSKKDAYFAPELAKYMLKEPCYLGTPNLFLAADANVIPTAKNPLQGLAGMTHAGVSLIVPAVKLALQCTAALKGGQGKDLFSTGAVTKRNYVQRKAGQVAQHEHNIAALFVTVSDDGTYEATQLEQMTGFNGFYHMHQHYTGDGVESVPDAVAALQFGDIHAEKMTAENADYAVKLARVFRPAHIMLHDVLDFSSRNHHNIKDPFFVAENDAAGNSVVGDLTQVANFVNSLMWEIFEEEKYLPDVHVIESNHDLALERWVKDVDWKKDALNAGTYLPLANAMVRAAYTKAPLNLLQYALTRGAHTMVDAQGRYGTPLNDLFASKVIFHNTDESVMLAGVEHGCHGHSGINGARGAPTQFRTLGVAMNTGHTHTPGICGKVYTAGVSASLEMGYNVGPSSWRLAHIVTYKNGQRQVIFN